jgi:U4/U6.U5 tri-snRNP-associated protein 1
VPKDEQDPGSTLESREAAGYDNYRKLQEAEKAKKVREQRNAEIKRQRDRAQRDVALVGKGLADHDDADLGADTKSWLRKQEKRRGRIEQARKQEAEKAAAAEAAAKEAARQYSADGVTIAHDVSVFLDGGDQILTLKDTGVLDEDEGDELEALALREEEKLQERLNLKKKKPLYDPTEETEQGILAQYDELDGKKKKSFTLGAIMPTKDSIDDILESAPVQKRRRDVHDLEQLGGLLSRVCGFVCLLTRRPA